MRARMRALARGVVAAAVLAGAAWPVSARAEETETPSTAPAEAPTYPFLHLNGFTDFGYFATDAPQAAPSSSYFEGQFVLHFVSALSPRFSFFGEVSLTARRDAAQSAASAGFNAEVERSILKYTQSDRLKLSAGRYHTPINYWNTAFHHGQWLQTTVSRPEMIRFGGRFLPVHFVGVLLEGSAPVGGSSVGYDVGLGNGRSTVISRGGDAGDVNDNRAWLAGLRLQPDRPYGLQAGGAVYRDEITLPAGSHEEWIFSGYVAYTKETPELIAEYAHVRHRSLSTNRVSKSPAYYVQVAYRLGFHGKRWKPYFRWEDIDVASLDEVFVSLEDRRGFLAGVRCDVSELAALKAEYRRQRSAADPYANELFLQASLTF